jgi:tripartite-type tricarboxylate transporter receptor subunit TctC
MPHDARNSSSAEECEIMSFGKGVIGGLAVLFALSVTGGPTGAQEYPTRPITVIVPFAAGGPTDVVARIVGDHMSKTLGQQLNVAVWL